MRAILLLYIFVNYSPAKSQISFPRVEKAKHPQIQIDGSFVPTKEFLKQNPDFMETGKYVLDSFNASNYPAIFCNSLHDLKGCRDIHFRFITRDLFPVDEENAFQDPIDLNYHEIKNMLKDNYSRFGSNNEHGKRAYKEFNDEYILTINHLAETKKLSGYTLGDLGSHDFDISKIKLNTIVLEFEYVDNSLGRMKAPYYDRYRLNVKNVFDSIIKSYGQVVFFDAKVKEEKYMSFLGEYVTIYQTYGVAMESLLNQLLEDDTMREYLHTEMSNEKNHRRAIKDVGLLIELQEKRKTLIKLVDITNTVLKSYANYDIFNVNVENITSDLKVNTIVNLASTVIGSLDAASKAKAIERAKTSGNDLIYLIDFINSKEKELMIDLQKDQVVHDRFINSNIYEPLTENLSDVFKKNVAQAYKSSAAMKEKAQGSLLAFMQSATALALTSNQTQEYGSIDANNSTTNQPKNFTSSPLQNENSLMGGNNGIQNGVLNYNLGNNNFRNSGANGNLFGPQSGCRDASREVTIRIEKIGQTQRIHLVNNSSSALIIQQSHSYGNVRNKISELGKVIPGEEAIFRVEEGGNWYAIVTYLSDACKSCPNNSKSDPNESNNWDLECTRDLNDQLCKKYFNDCY